MKNEGGGFAAIIIGRSAPFRLAFPIGEGGPRQWWIGYCRQWHTCPMHFPIASSGFHTACALSASLCSAPSPRGEGCDTREALSKFAAKPPPQPRLRQPIIFLSMLQ